MSNQNFDQAAEREAFEQWHESQGSPGSFSGAALAEEAWIAAKRHAMESRPQDDPDTELAIGLIRNNEIVRNALSFAAQIGGIKCAEDEIQAVAEALGFGPGEVQFADYDRTPMPDGTIAVVKCGERARPLLAEYRVARFFGPPAGFRTLEDQAYIDDAVTHFAVI